MAKISKLHHYIPRLILREFANEAGQLNFVRRSSQTITTAALRNLFAENYLYSRIREDGSKDVSLENVYAKLEGSTAVILASLISAARNGEAVVLTSEDRRIIDKFIYHLWRRTPDVFDRMFPAESDQEAISLIEVALREKQHQLIIDDIEKLRIPGNAKRIINNTRLEVLQAERPEILGAFSEFELHVVVVADRRSSFIVGSYPVLALNGEKLSTFVSTGTEIWVPIAPDVALCLCSPLSFQIVAADQALVRKVNEMIVARSSSIASHSEALLRSLAKAVWGVRLKS
jgi:hypothetical protein